MSQAEPARTLAISPSYLNQMEHDARPLTVPVLLRLTEAFGVDPAFFSERDTGCLVADLREALSGELAAARVTGTDLADLASRLPAVAQVLVDLGRRNHRLAERLTEAADPRSADPGGTDPELPLSPHEEIRDFFYRRQNYLHATDLAAEALATEIGVRPGDILRALTARLADHHGVRFSSEADDRLHSYDEETRTLRLSSRLRPGQRAFRMATQLALLEYGDGPGPAGGRGLPTRRPGPPAGPHRHRELLRRRADPAVPGLPHGGGGVQVRHREAHRPLRSRLRDGLPPPQHPPAPATSWSPLLLRPGRPCGEHVQAAVRHRLPLLPRRRHLPAVERVRGVRRARPYPRPGRRHARRTAPPVDRACPHPPPGRLGRTRQDLRHRPRLRGAARTPAGVLGRTGSRQRGRRHPDRHGLSRLRTARLPQRGAPPLGRPLRIDQNTSTFVPYPVADPPA